MADLPDLLTPGACGGWGSPPDVDVNKAASAGPAVLINTAGVSVRAAGVYFLFGGQWGDPRVFGFRTEGGRQHHSLEGRLSAKGGGSPARGERVGDAELAGSTTVRDPDTAQLTSRAVLGLVLGAPCRPRSQRPGCFVHFVGVRG